jgi:hypothetical protein
MKRKKLSQLQIKILFFAVSIIFVVVLLRVEEFKGNLENYDTFGIIDNNEEYDLLRVMNNLDEETNLALYSKDISLQFDFYDNDILIYSIDNGLIEGDYLLFNLNQAIDRNIKLVVSKETVILDELTFYYTNNYKNIEYVIMNDMDFDLLLLQENIESRSIIVELMISDNINPIIVISIFIVMILVILIPYHRIFSYLFSKEAKKIFERVFIHIMLSIILFGITLFIYVSIFVDEEESTSQFDNVDYIYEETDMFKVDISVGIVETFWFSGSQLEVVYRLKLITFDNDLDYTGIFKCDNESFGYVRSIDESVFSFDQVREVFIENNCQSIETFHIDIVDTKTGVLIYQTENYKLYKDIDETISTFNFVENSNGKLISLSIFLFHFLITTTLLDILIYKVDKKRVLPLIKIDNDDSKNI